MSTEKIKTGRTRHRLLIQKRFLRKPKVFLALQVEEHEKGEYESPDLSPDGYFDSWPVDRVYWRDAVVEDLQK